MIIFWSFEHTRKLLCFRVEQEYDGLLKNCKKRVKKRPKNGQFWPNWGPIGVKNRVSRAFFPLLQSGGGQKGSKKGQKTSKNVKKSHFFYHRKNSIWCVFLDKMSKKGQKKAILPPLWMIHGWFTVENGPFHKNTLFCNSRPCKTAKTLRQNRKYPSSVKNVTVGILYIVGL